LEKVNEDLRRVTDHQQSLAEVKRVGFYIVVNKESEKGLQVLEG